MDFVDQDLLISTKNRRENNAIRNDKSVLQDPMVEDMNQFKLSNGVVGEGEPLNDVLVVDDCPFNIVAVKSLLEQFNIKCDSCVNGLEAVKSVQDRVLSQ